MFLDLAIPLLFVVVIVVRLPLCHLHAVLPLPSYYLWPVFGALVAYLQYQCRRLCVTDIGFSKSGPG